MQPDGSYLRLSTTKKERLSSQEYFCRQALAVTQSRKHATHSTRTFEPLMHETEE